MKTALLLAAALVSVTTPALADRLDDIKKAGVIRVAAFDSNPPFGFLDAKSHQLVGLDVDVAQAIAKKIGVKVELVPTNPANRIPLLVSGKADIVAANFTITDERKKQIDFSDAYFASGQQFIARKDALKTPEQLKGLRVGVDKGTTQEITLREKYPDTTVVASGEDAVVLEQWSWRVVVNGQPIGEVTKREHAHPDSLPWCAVWRGGSGPSITGWRRSDVVAAMVAAYRQQPYFSGTPVSSFPQRWPI